MKIVGVAACTSGIAHTYIAKEKLIKAAKSLGHEIWIETQGTIGVEDALTTNQIRDADVVILAIDIQISGKERFSGTGFPIHIARKESFIRLSRCLWGLRRI